MNTDTQTDTSTDTSTNTNENKEKRSVSTLLQHTHKQDILMDALIEYYNKKENIDKLLEIFKETSPISLRVIDWFVTNYSKKNNIKYQFEKKTFNVYIDYKLQLKGYSKKQFDPFCRRERIKFFYNNNEYIVTTVGQLNFFRWAFIHKILDYINENLHKIENDMNNNYKAVYSSKNKINNKRRQRHELSICATKSITKNNIKIIVSFD